MKNKPTFQKGFFAWQPFRLRQVFLLTSVFLLTTFFAHGADAFSVASTIKRPVNYSADIHVTGTVKDESGRPLPGVSIQVMGTTSGNITDARGHFEIDVAANSTLTFSNIGYKTQQIKVGSKSQVLNVHLVPSANELNQLVVVGYGTQKKNKYHRSCFLCKREGIK